MGRVMSDEDILLRAGDRYTTPDAFLQWLNNSPNLYAVCDVCHRDFCVNCGYEDGKPRTPKYKNFVICLTCDPRHPDDRWDDKPRIVSRPKLRLVQMAQVVKAVANKPCFKAEPTFPCKCPSCVAGKMFPPF